MIKRLVCRLRGHKTPDPRPGTFKGVHVTALVCARCHQVVGVSGIGTRKVRRQQWKRTWRNARP